MNNTQKSTKFPGGKKWLDLFIFANLINTRLTWCKNERPGEQSLKLLQSPSGPCYIMCAGYIHVIAKCTMLPGSLHLPRKMMWMTLAWSMLVCLMKWTVQVDLIVLEMVISDIPSASIAIFNHVKLRAWLLADFLFIQKAKYPLPNCYLYTDAFILAATSY